VLSTRIELRGEDLFCADTGEDGTSTVRPLTAETLARLKDWAERYDAAMRSRAAEPLVEIGRDIAAFLDEGDRWLDRVLDGTGEIALEIRVSGTPDERERVLLDVPWETIAPKGMFLAADNERLFRIARRLGRPQEPAVPPIAIWRCCSWRPRSKGKASLITSRRRRRSSRRRSRPRSI